MTGALVPLFWAMVSMVTMPPTTVSIPGFADEIRAYSACVQMHMDLETLFAGPGTTRQSPAERRQMDRRIQQEHMDASMECRALAPDPSAYAGSAIANATGSPVDVIVG